MTDNSAAALRWIYENGLPHSRLRPDFVNQAFSDAFEPTREHNHLYAELCRISGELGPDAPETIAAHEAVKRSGRARRNHYAGVSDRQYGRI